MSFGVVNPRQTMQVEAIFVVEGNLSGHEVMDRFSAKMKADPRSAFATGPLSAAPSSVKFVQGDNTLFDKPASSLKAVEDLQWGFFRIVFNDGKVYNFKDTTGPSVCDGGKYKGATVSQALKKKFGK